MTYTQTYSQAVEYKNSPISKWFWAGPIKCEHWAFVQHLGALSIKHFLYITSLPKVMSVQILRKSKFSFCKKGIQKSKTNWALI